MDFVIGIRPALSQISSGNATLRSHSRVMRKHFLCHKLADARSTRKRLRQDGFDKHI